MDLQRQLVIDASNHQLPDVLKRANLLGIRLFLYGLFGLQTVFGRLQKKENALLKLTPLY